MDLDRLSEFLMIAEEKSIKGAASRLGVAPNVLSTRLKSFEWSLGTELFDRNAHKFELTRSGESLLQNAKGLLDSYDHILVSLKSVGKTGFQSLNLQLLGQTMAAELGPFLDRYCRQHPSMFLNLYDENTCLLMDGLRSGMVDIAFAVGREEDYSDCPGRIAVNHFPRMKVHVPWDHRLAKRKTVRFAELEGETFILYPKMQERCTRELQLSMLRQAGIRFGLYEDTSSPFFYDLLVPIGKGIRLWNWNDRTAPNTQLLTIQDKGYETNLYLLYNPATQNAAALDFIDSFLQFRKERK